MQCDIDVIGSKIRDEVDILSLAKEALNKMGIKSVIYFNNRKLLNEILDKEGVSEKDKVFVIKEIDKLDKLPEKEIKENLKKYNAEKILEVFKKPENYFSKYDSYKDVKEFGDYLSLYKVEAKFSPSLARGLSYYNGTVFEIKTDKMKDTICGGGSYEFNGIQCTGISFGLDRLAILADFDFNKNNFLVVSLDEDRQAIKIAEMLRQRGDVVSIYYGKPSKFLICKFCNIKQVIFVGSRS